MEEVDELLRRIKAAVKVMRWYLILLLPLAKVPLIRMLLDNIHVQIIAFNLVRDIEEFVLRFISEKVGR
ncbi:MAG: hypothetical protein MZU91_13455 [Desulfosudis oleivorans]|nr:hypothetical protein [Desulfosudis oleivorans]